MKIIEKYKIDLIVDSWTQTKLIILSLLERDKNATLLDCGCGDCRFTEKMVSAIGCYSCYGIDQERIVRGNVTIYDADLNEEIPFESNFFDVVIASQAIEHLWNTDKFLKEIRRVLKRGAYTIISTPNLASWHNVAYLVLGLQPETCTVSDELYSWKEKPGHRRVFTATELIKLLDFHGFRVEDVIGTSYYPFKGSTARFLAQDWRHASVITVKARKK